MVSSMHMHAYVQNLSYRSCGNILTYTGKYPLTAQIIFHTYEEDSYCEFLSINRINLHIS